MHVILIFGERSLFLGKLRRSQKTASPGHKNDFFHQNLFFFSGSHPRQLFFAKKRTHFGQVQPPEPCVEKKPAYRGSPPCTIFLTSSEQRNIVQLCTTVLYVLGMHSKSDTCDQRQFEFAVNLRFVTRDRNSIRLQAITVCNRNECSDKGSESLDLHHTLY